MITALLVAAVIYGVGAVGSAWLYRSIANSVSELICEALAWPWLAGGIVASALLRRRPWR